MDHDSRDPSVNNLRGGEVELRENSDSAYNVGWLSASFCLVFLAFSAVQNYQTSSDHEDDGSLALGILYAFFTVTNIFASYIVSTIGPKLSLIIGALTYGLFVAANIVFNRYLLFAASALIGVGAAILWCAQGVYMTRCASYHEITNGLPESSTMGFFNGLFFSIFQVNQFAGNLLVALLFQEDVTQWIIFCVLTAIAGVGWSMLFFLKNVDRVTLASSSLYQQQQQQQLSGVGAGPLVGSAIDEPEVKPVSLWETLALLLDVRMIMLVPIFIYSGLNQGWIFGEFPPLITANSTKFYVMACFGAADAFSSILFGKLSDRIGRLPTLFLGFLAHIAVYIFLLFYTVSQDADQQYIFFLLSVLLGVGDAVYNTQIYAILGTCYEKQAEPAFANFKLFQSMSMAASFFAHKPFSFTVKTIVPLGFAVIGTLLVFVVSWCLPPSGGPTTPQERSAAEKQSQEHLLRNAIVDD